MWDKVTRAVMESPRWEELSLSQELSGFRVNLVHVGLWRLGLTRLLYCVCFPVETFAIGKLTCLHPSALALFLQSGWVTALILIKKRFHIARIKEKDSLLSLRKSPPSTQKRPPAKHTYIYIHTHTYTYLLQVVSLENPNTASILNIAI